MFIGRALLALVFVGAMGCGDSRARVPADTLDDSDPKAPARNDAPSASSRPDHDPRPVEPEPSQSTLYGSVAPAACSGRTGRAGDTTITLESSGLARKAFVHAPPGYDPGRATALVIAFPYEKASADRMDWTTGLEAEADEANVLLVYPLGVEQTWNVGQCCGYAFTEDINDVQYTKDLLSELEADYCVDTRRVYAAGFSGGGEMAYRVACEMTDRFAALGVVSAAVHTSAPCVPERPLATLHIHGTADTVVPYDGGEGVQATIIAQAGSHDYMSVADTEAIWLEADACGEGTVTTYRKGDVTCVARSSCAEGTTVELCTVQGGGHTWPEGNLPAYLGYVTQDLDASSKLMHFFAEHTAP